MRLITAGGRTAGAGRDIAGADQRRCAGSARAGIRAIARAIARVMAVAGMSAAALALGAGPILDTVPFETRTSLHISDPGLRRFWAFETSTAAARAMYELLLVLQGVDPDFETIAAPPKLPPVTVPRSRFVDRSLAGTLARLAQAEQDEIQALQALVVSMDRATEASAVRGRWDWVRWQLSAAAGFAAQTQSALERVISAQRVASRALVRRGLRFGIGSVDVRLAVRQVRRHGLAATLRSTMASLEMAPDLIAQCAREFGGPEPPAVSVNLSELLASAMTIRAERSFQAALTHFGARTPRASPPPS